jgi:hypothetical protein
VDATLTNAAGLENIMVNICRTVGDSFNAGSSLFLIIQSVGICYQMWRQLEYKNDCMGQQSILQSAHLSTSSVDKRIYC